MWLLNGVTVDSLPGYKTMVVVGSTSRAGPAIRSPGCRTSPRYTGISTSPRAEKYARAWRDACGLPPARTGKRARGGR